MSQAYTSCLARPSRRWAAEIARRPALDTSTPAFTRRPLRPHKELLIAWTLLLLDDEAIHGYRLHHELEARGVGIQTASMYRWLRKFENERWLVSRWSEPVEGPRRHIYRPTAEGRATLHDMSELIAATRVTYSAFVQAHEGAVARREGAGSSTDESAMPVPRGAPSRPAREAETAAAPASELRPLRPHKELLVGWLLLHLDAGATYGYDLRREFNAHRLTPDPSTVYRMLRKLETDKWVQSRWLSPAAGPRRRFYRLTTRGRRNLDEIALLIAAIRDSHDAYLRVYEDVRSRAGASTGAGEEAA